MGRVCLLRYRKGLPLASDLRWRETEWITLNHLRAAIVRIRMNLLKWGYIEPTADVSCPICGLPEAATVPHFLECSSVSRDDLLSTNERAKTQLRRLQATCDGNNRHEKKSRATVLILQHRNGG